MILLNNYVKVEVAFSDSAFINDSPCLLPFGSNVVTSFKLTLKLGDIGNGA